MKKIIRIVLVIIVQITGLKLAAQNVGIGTETPAARLHITDSSVLFSAQGIALVTHGNTPIEGEGRRMMWYADKAAFRAGYVLGSEWNKNKIGNYSIAAGNSTEATNFASTAFGYNSAASGVAATALGASTGAFGYASTSLGYNTIASGNYTFTAGTAVTTNNHPGSFFFGDGDPNFKGMRALGFDNHFAARFNGGYYFISSDAGADIGVRVLPGGNAWVSISDENRKENFEPINSEDILQKIKDIKLSSWNYKMQDPKENRHYGIMAQDFYHAFGSDKYGAIGNDTTVNPIDMIGIDMAAIQALEKRTTELANRLDNALDLINLQKKEIELLKEQHKNLTIIKR